MQTCALPVAPARPGPARHAASHLPSNCSPVYSIKNSRRKGQSGAPASRDSLAHAHNSLVISFFAPLSYRSNIALFSTLHLYHSKKHTHALLTLCSLIQLQLELERARYFPITKSMSSYTCRWKTCPNFHSIPHHRLEPKPTPTNSPNRPKTKMPYLIPASTTPHRAASIRHEKGASKPAPEPHPTRAPAPHRRAAAKIALRTPASSDVPLVANAP